MSGQSAELGVVERGQPAPDGVAGMALRGQPEHHKAVQGAMEAASGSSLGADPQLQGDGGHGKLEPVGGVVELWAT